MFKIQLVIAATVLYLAMLGMDATICHVHLWNIGGHLKFVYELPWELGFSVEQMVVFSVLNLFTGLVTALAAISPKNI